MIPTSKIIFVREIIISEDSSDVVSEIITWKLWIWSQIPKINYHLRKEHPCLMLMYNSKEWENENEKNPIFPWDFLSPFWYPPLIF